MFVDSLYQIINKASFKSLQFESLDSEEIKLSTTNKSNSQFWKFVQVNQYFRIESISTNKCLSITKSKRVIYEEIKDSEHQLWKIEKKKGSYFKISSFLTNFVLASVPLEINWEKKPKLSVELRENKEFEEKVKKDEKEEQEKKEILWNLFPRKIAFHYIINMNSGKCLEIVDPNNPKSTICQSSPLGKSSQKWALLTAEDGLSFAIINKSNDLCLSTENEVSQDGEKIILSNFEGKKNQMWVFKNENPNDFYIVSKSDGKCIHVQAGGLEENEPINIYTIYKGGIIGENQLWSFVKI
ncbi:hypothetical protein M0811_11817 [Anaeramoeba ignava]|uniref:Ricin B lectin domain-containing protein n=1 Tax=Anaeramoeba ignava TaxID=1746090 RepID=A0A9Q0LB88_ANAIG|nr:hypothetical protein M0811_11817 [Anaeramoeba ignava]